MRGQSSCLTSMHRALRARIFKAWDIGSANGRSFRWTRMCHGRPSLRSLVDSGDKEYESTLTHETHPYSGSRAASARSSHLEFGSEPVVKTCSARPPDHEFTIAATA